MENKTKREKDKKIFVVLTGGTICSEYNGRVKSQGKKAGTVLEENFRNSTSEYADKVRFITTENYGIFSENMSVEKWNYIIKRLRSTAEVRDTAIARGNYPSLNEERVFSEENIMDGIIIAHGTDTLAYSSALFSLILRDIGVPVFLVSSNDALSSEKANGTANFIAATECICNGITPNVYVSYRNSDGNMYLHYASRLTQCRNYEEDFFSVGMTKIEDAQGKFFGKTSVCDKKANEDRIDLFAEWELENIVLKIDPYVGLNYDFYDFTKVKAVLHGTYHSGTVCVEGSERRKKNENSIVSLFEKCKAPVYIAPCDLEGNVYDTIIKVAENAGENVRFINGYTSEMMYVKLLIAYSENAIKDVDGFLGNEYNKELINRG